jgi:hypothetical protein
MRLVETDNLGASVPLRSVERVDSRHDAEVRRWQIVSTRRCLHLCRDSRSGEIDVGRDWRRQLENKQRDRVD